MTREVPPGCPRCRCACIEWVRGEKVEQVIGPALALYHSLVLTAKCLLMMRAGGCNILITNPRDIPGSVKELRKHKFTIFTGDNTLFNALMNHPDFTKIDFSGLNLALGGGMAAQ